MIQINLLNIFVLTVFSVGIYYLWRDKKRLSESSQINRLIKRINLNKSNLIYELLKETELSMIWYIGLQLLVLILIIPNLSNPLKCIKLLIAAEAIIHVFVASSVSSFRAKLKNELCYIQESLYYQEDTGTPINSTLSYVAEDLTEPLKSRILTVAGAYSLRQDVGDAISSLRKISRVQELQSFCNILETRIETGTSEAAHEASISVLLRVKRASRMIKKRRNMLFLTTSGITLAGMVIAIIVVPMALNAYGVINTIFQR